MIKNWRGLTALAFSAFFALLHRPDGAPVYINAEQIDYIGPGVAEFDGPNAGSRLMVYGLWVAVKETPKQVYDQINHVLKQE